MNWDDEQFLFRDPSKVSSSTSSSFFSGNALKYLAIFVICFVITLGVILYFTNKRKSVNIKSPSSSTTTSKTKKSQTRTQPAREQQYEEGAAPPPSQQQRRPLSDPFLQSIYQEEDRFGGDDDDLYISRAMQNRAYDQTDSTPSPQIMRNQSAAPPPQPPPQNQQGAEEDAGNKRSEYKPTPKKKGGGGGKWGGNRAGASPLSQQDMDGLKYYENNVFEGYDVNENDGGDDDAYVRLAMKDRTGQSY